MAKIKGGCRGSTTHESQNRWRRKSGTSCEYIAREGEYSKRLEKGEKLEHTEYGNMPKWAEHNPLNFGKRLIYTSVKMAVPTANLKLVCLEN